MERHGESNTRLYRIWQDMKSRCYNSGDKVYKHYGDRGICVCDNWKFSYISFKNWAMENGYRDNLTIDRIDVNGNYEPSNCRWVDRSIQSANRRNTIFIKLNGETKTISEWSKIYNIPRSRIYKKYRKGLSFLE